MANTAGMEILSKWQNRAMLAEEKLEEVTREMYHWKIIARYNKEELDSIHTHNNELLKLIKFGNGEILMGWMTAHKKVMDKLVKAEAKIKELEKKKPEKKKLKITP